MSNIETIGNNTDKMMTLMSSDGISFSISIDTVNQSITIKHMLECLDNDDPIPIPNVNGDILKKVFTFCDYVHYNSEDVRLLEEWTNDRTFTVPLPQWFSNFITVEQTMLFDIVNAANFLDIQLLLNLGTKYIASLIRNKTPEELKVLFSAPSTTGAGPA
jgi:hypothetical protein